jgi:hypothetical protein
VVWTPAFCGGGGGEGECKGMGWAVGVFSINIGRECGTRCHAGEL